MKKKDVKIKQTQILVLAVGIIGVISSIVNMVLQKEVATEIIGFICGLSLIMGYFQLKTENDKTKKEEKTN